jgi:hypothetical protein
VSIYDDIMRNLAKRLKGYQPEKNIGQYPRTKDSFAMVKFSIPLPSSFGNARRAVSVQSYDIDIQVIVNSEEDVIQCHLYQNWRYMEDRSVKGGCTDHERFKLADPECLDKSVKWVIDKVLECLNEYVENVVTPMMDDVKATFQVFKTFLDMRRKINVEDYRSE